MKNIAVTFLLVASCAVDQPDVTVAIVPLTDRAAAIAPDAEVAASAWAPAGIGIVRDPADADVVVYLDRFDSLPLERDPDAWGIADRNTNTIGIWVRLDPDDPLYALEFCVAVAHEVGHVVLDTPEHARPDSGGIMSGEDCRVSAADLELACRTVGIGCGR
jgi:hypothetical protein